MRTWTHLRLAAAPACAQLAGPRLQRPEAVGAGGAFRGGQQARQTLLEVTIELPHSFPEPSRGWGAPKQGTLSPQGVWPRHRCPHTWGQQLGFLDLASRGRVLHPEPQMRPRLP